MKTDIMFIGVGGQGILTAISIIGESAIETGTNIIMSEVHGMAQRGGTVMAHVRMGDVHGPLIPNRGAEIMVAFEPVEAIRGVPKVAKDGVVIVNTSPIPPFTVSLGHQEYPPVDDILNTLKDVAGKVIAFDALKMAKESGSPLNVNMVMLGALAGASVLPFPKDMLREGVKKRLPKRYLEPALKAFDMGVKASSEILASLDNDE